MSAPNLHFRPISQAPCDPNPGRAMRTSYRADAANKTRAGGQKSQFLDLPRRSTEGSGHVAVPCPSDSVGFWTPQSALRRAFRTEGAQKIRSGARSTRSRSGPTRTVAPCSKYSGFRWRWAGRALTGAGAHRWISTTSGLGSTCFGLGSRRCGPSSTRPNLDGPDQIAPTVCRPRAGSTQLRGRKSGRGRPVNPKSGCAREEDLRRESTFPQ